MSPSLSASDSVLLQSVNPNEVAHMIALLQCLTEPDTATIRHAEAQLKPVLKQAASMAILWAVVVLPHPQQHSSHTQSTNTNNTGVRHSATLVLRKRLPAHFGRSMDAPTQLAWQTSVLQALAVEPVRPVRTGLCGVAAALAACAGSSTSSDDTANTNNTTNTNSHTLYLEFVAAANANHHDVNARELSFLLLSEMTDTVGNHWRAHAPALAQLYQTALTTNSNTATPPTNNTNVQKAAVRALGQLLSYWADDPEMDTMAPLLPSLLHVAAQHVHTVSVNHNSNNNNVADEDDEDTELISTVLDVLYDLAYSSSTALLPQVPVTLEFALSCLTCKALPLRVRDAAALVIATTAEAKPKTLGRQTALLGRILDALFQLMQDSHASAAGALFESNPAWRADLLDGNQNENDDDDDDDKDDAPTETSMAQGTLDMLACEIPKKFIWHPCLRRCVERMKAEHDPMARKAGVAGLGVIAEGCAEPLTAALPDIMPLVLQACADPAPPVRECACFCLGQISEHCQPDILSYSQQILPTVFALLDDQSVAVQATSCYVLEMFCERLEPAAVRPVLDPLVKKLAYMLEQPTQKRSVQEMAVAALAATAVAAEAEFAPYVAGVATLLTPFLTYTTVNNSAGGAASNHYSLRGRALECMGHMAIAVGRDPFRPYFAPTMQCAMEGLRLDSTDLQEFAYAVFANLAKVMKDEFAPALPDLVPFLIQVIQQEDGQFEKENNGDANNGLSGLDDSDDEDDDSQGGNMILHVRTALLEVKKGALTALGEMAAHTGTSFCPYIESSMQVLQKASTEWHPDVRKEAATAFPSLIVPSIAAYHNGELSWKRGDVDGKQSTALSQHTFTIVQAVLEEEIALLKDDDKGTVGKACEGIQSILELCGPTALSGLSQENFQALLSCTHELLSKVSNCYTSDVYEDEDYPASGGGGGAAGPPNCDDDEDHDVVTQAACDLVGAMCRVWGAHFKPYLPQFLSVILDYAKSSRPPSDRSMAVGCLSEIAQELEENIAEHWSNSFLPCLLASLADSDDNVKRNAAFCTGICAEHLRENIASDYPNLLTQLGPIFSLASTIHSPSDDDNDISNGNTAACVDNAAAAVARMIMACPSQVPMAQVLPVFLAALPLQTDETENETVYTCLLGLLTMKHPDLVGVQANMAQVQRIFSQACEGDSSVSEDIKSKIRATMAQP